jgi:uncharacterized phosphosugar-binding protein
LLSESGATRYLIGIREILGKIEREERDNIERAATVIFTALSRGHRAFSVCVNHIPPIANSSGTNGNPGIFLPVEYLLSELSFKSSHPKSFEGDVVLFSDQYNSSPPLEDLAFQVRQSGGFTIFVGPAKSVKDIPSVQPNRTLSEICDMTIDTHTPLGDALLKFDGLDVTACATSGVTTVALFYALNLEVAKRISKALLNT